MATITDGELTLVVPGASEAEVMKGLAAARAYLAVAGVKAADAFDAHCKPEYIEHSGQGATSDEDAELFEAWYEARRAAYNAAGCIGLPYETILTTADKTTATSNPDLGPHYTAQRDHLFVG